MEAGDRGRDASRRRSSTPASSTANRELSWLQFNERVLELAEDERIPLLERVKFLAIYASNLDEFYMVRVAGLHDQVDAGIDARKADGLSPSETIELVAQSARGSSAVATRASGRTHSPGARRARHPRNGPRRPRRRGARRSSTGRSTSRSSRCSRRSPWARAGRSRTSPTCRSPSRCGCATPWADDEIFARVKVPKEVLPRLLS